MKDPRLAGLYAVTPDGVGAAQCTAMVAAALRGGARLVQYRSKSGDAARRSDEARQLAALCRSAGAAFIVNDDLELARACGADGVHLGRDDAGIADARAVLGTQALVGASCYDSLALAREAVSQGADYVAFGSFFPSRTKPAAVRAGIPLLREATELGVAVCAIGGITADNGAALVEAGADMLAVVDGLFGAPDVEAEARRYAALWASRNGCARP